MIAKIIPYTIMGYGQQNLPSNSNGILLEGEGSNQTMCIYKVQAKHRYICDIILLDGNAHV